jgi:hypothetical protein
LLGLLAVAWVGLGYIGSNALALTMTAAIGAVYVVGALELLSFRRATSSLTTALAELPDALEWPTLSAWLDSLPPSLQNPVRLRIEGERVGLPGPALTPYLVGLLVMLGMLGTFLGMVVTLNGAVFALEGTTDLQAIRAALAAPIKGLGLAFGTSVAGVAASAMLGLLSALSRRERLLAAQRLDTRIATVLRVHSFAFQRQETFKALQRQAQALPNLVDQLQTMLARMERREEQFNERLLGNQDAFHGDVKTVYASLASAVEKSLKDNLADSARLANETIDTAVDAAMTGIARETGLMHEKLIDSTRGQLDSVAAAWQAALTTQRKNGDDLIDRLEQSMTAFNARFAHEAASLLNAVGETLSASLTRQAADDRQRLATWTQSLEAMAARLQREWQQAGAQALSQQQQICATLEKTARDIGEQAQANAGKTLDQAARLLETASEAPRVAADVIKELRLEMSRGIARDKQLLDERCQTMASLNSLLVTIDRSAEAQRATLDAMVASTTELLGRTGRQFAEQVGAESARLTELGACIGSGAVEVSSLSDAFAFAVGLFGEANEKLIANLQRIEAAMEKSTARSDEQLAYYVAQAREIIDLSLLSQKAVMDELRQIADQPATLAEQAP